MTFELPPTTHARKFCKLEKQITTITGTLKFITIENVTFYFHKCNNNSCKHKTTCLYIFPTSHYRCHTCNTIIKGTPPYKISNRTQICKNCGATLMNTRTTSNLRMMI